MITPDRIELNDRFRVVFALLEERGVIVKNDRGGKGMGDFAHKILGNRAYGHIIRAYLNEDDKRVISYSQARTLCREFGISESYMLDGEGSPFDTEVKIPDAILESIGAAGKIKFTTFEGFAGFATDSGAVARDSDTEYFNLPGINGDGLIAFPINGNSMEPVIEDGDVVICKEVSSFKDLRENSIYAVKSNGAVWIKYVRPILDEKNRVKGLKLISANHLEHDPFEEDVNDRTQLYQVIRRISSL